MATQKFMLQELSWDERYQVANTDNLITPALVIYPENIAANIASTLNVLAGNADSWRAHVKTAKLNYTLRMLLDRGVHNFKCATTLELLQACSSGAADVLLAYPVMAANARRVREIKNQFPRVLISVLAENEEQVQQWPGTDIGIFLDINPGMNRTGIEQENVAQVRALAQSVKQAGLEFRGLHYYDGQFGSVPEPERTIAAHEGYAKLLQLVRNLEHSGVNVSEVITAGTPTLPCSVAYKEFESAGFVHRVSPGTVVYNDASSLAQLPSLGYAPAALVLARVVSHPHHGIITCDAGHKAVSADAGVPTCIALGHPELTSLSPSEEHLPFAVREGSTPPPVGDLLYLLPRHVCPTVNNFDAALIVRNGKIESVERASARGHEGPLYGEVDPGTREAEVVSSRSLAR
jgi:D-serine deaminase-like pyridoxal phosphate-dependent protein